MIRRMYQPKRASRSEFVPIRGLRYHVRTWGEPAPGKVPLVLVHGWMDVAASWQFVVDAFAREPYVIAPDWRGYGLTELPRTDNYWFPDYLADLDALLDHYAPEAQAGEVNLVGHSLGANVACFYAGVRPERVRRVVDLEGFGMPATAPAQAPARVRQWLDEMRAPPQLRPYATLDEVAARLVKTNPRLAPARARFLAQHWSKPAGGKPGEGGYMLLGDPAHKMVNPVLYRIEEVMAVWACVRAKVLHVEATQSETLARIAGKVPIDVFKKRFEAFPDWRERFIDDAGHMVHHDQPEAVAHLIEAFCAG